MSVLPIRSLAVLVSLVMTATACGGSRLDPETVARANGGMAGQPGAAVASTDGGVSSSGGDTAGGTKPGSAGGGSAGGGSGGAGANAGGAAGSQAGSGGGGSATGGVKSAACDGFKNQTGITGDTITIANASDISGPVPGLFESAQLATRAYVEFFNSQNSICGRKLKLLNLDSRTDAGADQQAYAEACSKAFAAVGSMSGFDSGGAGTAESCGLPDIRAAVTMPERQQCSTCFGTNVVKTNLVPDAHLKWLKKTHASAAASAAYLYINAGAAPVNAKSQVAAWKKVGINVKHVQGIDTAEFNFAPYVQQLKDKGIKMVGFMGPYQNVVKLQQAMQQQSYKPDVFIQDGTLYDQRYIDQAGDLAEGTMVYLSHPLFTDTSNKEVQLYLSWLQQVKPGAVPNYFGLYAWSAARLFVEKATALGGKLDRKAMVAALGKTSGWTAHGLHAKQDVGGRRTPNCLLVAQYKGGKWKQISPGDYMCGGLIDTGIG